MRHDAREEDPGLGRVVFDEIRHAHRRDYLGELKDLYYFYLDEDSRAELAGQGRIRRAFVLLGWLLRSLLTKLSPARRTMLLVGLVFGVLGDTAFNVPSFGIGADLRPIGFFLLLIVLMLELKDKLLARDEIQIARQVQLALLPQSHPHIPGWKVWSVSKPANDVGGDLVDYMNVGGFRHGIVLADVAGKGLGAALLTAKLQATLSALVPEAPSLDELGARVNTILYRDGLDNRYATLFYTELEHNSGQARYVNAGHNPALVLRENGVEALAASSFPLGMLPESNYLEGELDLAPGDVLLAYSDGLTEACNPEGEEFGSQRLEAAAVRLRGGDPEAIGRAIVSEVDAFTAGTRLPDDLSLVVIVRS